jgi:molybdopterin-guanine dinucleotide biosynthesis protein MobB
MSDPIVIGVYGHSNTGKTTLIVQLVEHLTKEGYSVATIKRTNKSISLDTIGKDTQRHHRAGAHLVVFSSAKETDFLVNESMSTSEIVRRIDTFSQYDLVLVEGADDPRIPKIKIGSCDTRENTIGCYENNFNEILRFVKRNLKKTISSRKLTVMVNGKEIPLTEFPEQILLNTIVGMLRSLKGVRQINEVSIQLKR